MTHKMAATDFDHSQQQKDPTKPRPAPPPPPPPLALGFRVLPGFRISVVMSKLFKHWISSSSALLLLYEERLRVGELSSLKMPLVLI
jgi:hypothetical protein